jgi:excisionase family DNA binding protein
MPVIHGCCHGMAEQQRFMLVHEVAREARVSLSTVRHWLRSGRLRSVRPGRRRMIARSDFERFVASLPSQAARTEQ